MGGRERALVRDRYRIMPTIIGGAAAAIPGVGPVIAGLEQAVDVIGKIFSEISGFISKADPGAFRALTNSLNNMQASIGSMLMPVVDVLIPVMDTLNEVFTSLGAAIQQAWQAMQPVFKPLLEYLQVMGKHFANLITIIGNIAAPIIKVIAHVLGAIVGFITTIMSYFEKLTAWLAGKSGAGKTYAAQGVQSMTPEAFAAGLQEASFGGPQRDLLAEIAENTDRTARNTAQPEIGAAAPPMHRAGQRR